MNSSEYMIKQRRNSYVSVGGKMPFDPNIKLLKSDKKITGDCERGEQIAGSYRWHCIIDT